MAAKRIQVSTDNGVTWRTLPGNTGDFREELATNNDTVFGQDFESNEVSVGQWGISGNSWFKGISGYQANLKQSGAPVVMTAEAMALVSGKTYRITNTAKRIIDYFSTLTVLDNAIDRTANVASIDYLNGEVTFLAAYNPVGPVTITGKYVPTATIARAKGFTLNQGAGEKDTTDYETARANGGWRTFDYGLKTVGLEVSGIYDVTNGAAAALRGRNPLVVDISPDNSATTFFRGYFKRHTRSQSGDVGNLEEETVNFGLWVPDGALVVRPFGWYFDPASALNPAVQNVLASWQSKLPIDLRYQDDPGIAGSGHTGDAIVTECTLSNALEGLNEFRFGFRGTGAPIAV
jgi:hypothetical protein